MFHRGRGASEETWTTAKQAVRWDTRFAHTRTTIQHQTAAAGRLWPLFLLSILLLTDPSILQPPNTPDRNRRAQGQGSPFVVPWASGWLAPQTSVAAPAQSSCAQQVSSSRRSRSRRHAAPVPSVFPLAPPCREHASKQAAAVPVWWVMTCGLSLWRQQEQQQQQEREQQANAYTGAE